MSIATFTLTLFVRQVFITWVYMYRPGCVPMIVFIWMCTPEWEHMYVLTKMCTLECTDVDMYTCMYWHCCVVSCMQVLELYILQCDISKRIVICIAIFSLISLPTWFTLVSLFGAEKLRWKRCWICQTRHKALLLCWRFENYVFNIVKCVSHFI